MTGSQVADGDMVDTPGARDQKTTNSIPGEADGPATQVGSVGRDVTIYNKCAELSNTPSRNPSRRWIIAAMVLALVLVVALAWVGVSYLRSNLRATTPTGSTTSITDREAASQPTLVIPKGEPGPVAPATSVSGQIAYPSNNAYVPRCTSARGFASVPSGDALWLIILVTNGNYELISQVTPNIINNQWVLPEVTIGGTKDVGDKPYNMLLMYTDGSLSGQFGEYLYPHEPTIPPQLLDSKHILDHITIRRTTMVAC